MRPKLHVGRCLGHHARIGSILITTTDGVVNAAGFRRVHVENRWIVDSWDALRGLPWDVTEIEANAIDAEQTLRPQIIRLPLAPRRRYVTRADVRKFGVAAGCTARADIAVLGKTSKPHADECRAWLGEKMECNPEGQGRLQAHKR